MLIDKDGGDLPLEICSDIVRVKVTSLLEHKTPCTVF